MRCSSWSASFALERQADAGEHTSVAALHARSSLGLAATLEPELTGDNSATAVAELTLEVDDVRAALDHAIATGDGDVGLELAAATWRYWPCDGPAEGRWVLTGAAAGGRGRLDPIRAGGLGARAGLAYWLGDFASRP